MFGSCLPSRRNLSQHNPATATDHELTLSHRTATAKRAYLSLLASPPEALQPTATHTPKLQAYTGPDVSQIFTAVQNRPRSRSNAGSGGHSRKGSLLGSGGGSALGGQVAQGGGVLGHQRSLSFGRERNGRSGGSWGQKQMKEMMDAAGVNGESAIGGDGGDSPPPVPSIPDHLAKSGANSRGSSPVDGRRSPEAYRPAFGGAPGSPEQLRRSGGASPPTVGAGSHRRSGKLVFHSLHRRAKADSRFVNVAQNLAR